LHRFINCAHASAADFAEDTVLAQLLGYLAIRGSLVGRRSALVASERANFFNHDQGGKKLADALGQMGMLASVLG
jgi:hypothetical protein